MNRQSFLIISLFNLLFTSCEDKAKQPKTNTAKENTIAKTDTEDKHNSLNAVFIGDTLLHGYTRQMQYYLGRYLIDTCVIQKYSDSTLIKEFEGVNQLGDLNSDNLIESVFVLPPLNYCENGESYYFSDINIPRILTDSYCCHPESIFNIGDIDEDGFSEMGQYYSSCASRYKSLIVYSLKDNKWKEIGHCTFDLNYSKYETSYKTYVRKTAKGKFEMLEITDLTDDKTKIGKKNWLKFVM